MARAKSARGRCAVLLVLLAALGLSQRSQAGASVVMVYTISRHGARNALPKSSLLKESPLGPTLLPQGQRMCYAAGSAFRARYIDTTRCGATCLANPTNSTGYGLVNQQALHLYNTLVRASATDRAILSAQSFYAGVFPVTASTLADSNTTGLPTGQQIVPIYSTPDNDDWLIRAYTKCRTYDDRLMDWYASEEFKQREAASLDLRETVRMVKGSYWLNPSINNTLANWWNVYDAMNVWYTYGVGAPQPEISADVRSEVQALAWWLELAKMRNSLTSNLLGGPLVADVLQHLDAAVSAVDSGSIYYMKLLSISSHYNAQLGFLAALRQDAYAPAVAALPWLNATLPQLASMLVLELHSSSGAGARQYAVRLVAQQGPSADYTSVPMSCSVAGDEAEALAGPGACTLAAFEALASPVALQDPASWCTACRNKDATPCQVVAQTSSLDATHDDLSDSRRDTKLAIGLGVGLTFLVTAAVAVVVFGVVYVRARAKWSAQHYSGGRGDKLVEHTELP